MSQHDESHPAEIQFPLDKLVAGRWRVVRTLGQGGCGIVYEVEDMNNKPQRAALKVEPNNAAGGVLKIEAEVLKQLQDRPYTIRLLQSAKRQDYSFIVLTLCGPDLDNVRELHSLPRFTESTTLRIGIHCLYAIKQLHEIGYIHRDVKPNNMVIGVEKHDRRLVYLIDYGMVRRYASEDHNNKWVLKQPRSNTALRGTLRYCSVNVHKRRDQGRVDDLWSLVYMMAELRGPLPWIKCTREDRLIIMKNKFDTGANHSAMRELDCLKPIVAHLSTCGFGDRPDYLLIFNSIMKQIRAKGYRFSDPYDWETSKETAPNASESSRSEISRNSNDTNTPSTMTAIDGDDKTQNENTPRAEEPATAIERPNILPDTQESLADEALFPHIKARNFLQCPGDIPGKKFTEFYKKSVRRRSRRPTREEKPPSSSNAS